MDWSFTEEQEQLAALTREILIGSLTEERMRATAASASRLDLDVFRRLGEAGVLGVALPAELGGGGYGLLELCRVLVEIGRVVAPVPVWPTIVLGAMPIARFGNDEQRTWVRAAAQGDVVLTAALTEELNPNAATPVVEAVRSGGGWSISGAKTAVPAGPIAERILVPATTDAGVTVFVVEASDPGLSMHSQEVTDLSFEGSLELDGVQVGEDRVLGAVGQGAEIVPWMARHATVALCAQQLGVCERALELTAEYSKVRVQFDRPIATFQAVGQRLADAYTDVEAIRLTMWQAAWRLSEGLPCDAEIETAKFWASDAGHRIAHTTVHVHGGVGIDLDYPAHRYFVAAKRNEFALGSATEQLVALGASLASEPA
jgi:3-oxocholest-4-en-26-oyl-CoA dehydrogenase beta subunit